MAKKASSAVVFLVDGYNLLSANPTGLSHKVESLQVATHGLGDSFEASTPLGMRKASMAQEGAFFQTEVANIHELFNAQALTPASVGRIVVLGFSGNTIGQPILGFEGGAYSQVYEVLAKIEDLTRANVEYTVSGKAEDGVILHALTAETADAATEPGSSVDHTTEVNVHPNAIIAVYAASNGIQTKSPHGLTSGDTVFIAGHSGSTPDINGIQTVASISTPDIFVITTDITVSGSGGTVVQAKSNQGGAGFLEVTALTLGTWASVTITFRHSADNSTFADLLIMTTRTATGAERKVLAPGAVNRYLAVSTDFVGAGSGGTMTFLAGFARY